MKLWRVYGDGQDLHLAVEGRTPLEAKDKTLLLFPRFFFVGIKQLEMTLDPKREERREYEHIHPSMSILEIGHQAGWRVPLQED